MSGPLNPAVYTAALTSVFSEPLPKLDARRLPSGVIAVTYADMELQASPRSGMVYAMRDGVLSHAVLDRARCDLVAQLAERVIDQHQDS